MSGCRCLIPGEAVVDFYLQNEEDYLHGNLSV